MVEKILREELNEPQEETESMKTEKILREAGIKEAGDEKKESVYEGTKKAATEVYHKAVDKPLEALKAVKESSGYYEIKEDIRPAMEKGAAQFEGARKAVSAAYEGFQKRREEMRLERKQELIKQVEHAELKARLHAAKITPQRDTSLQKLRDINVQKQMNKLPQPQENPLGSPMQGGNPLGWGMQAQPHNPLGGGVSKPPALFAEAPAHGPLRREPPELFGKGKGKPKWMDL